MANKLIKRRYNNLLTARNNYFTNGGSMYDKIMAASSGYNIAPVADKSNLQLENVNMPTPSTESFLSGNLGKALIGGAGQIGGSLIGGGMQSGVGNALQGLSSIAGAIPGPWGTVASAGLGILGGFANRAVGSKMDFKNIAKVEANINRLNNFQSNASDFDTLSQNWANADVGMTFSDSFIGKDGWFSNKAKNKAADLRREVEAGNAWVQNSLNNNAENIGTTQMQNLLANYAAFGGPLFAKGGRIHIKPENRGKFTETKRRTGKTTEELTHSKNPLTRKRAIFAQNAKKWHHAFGGDLMTHGADFDTGVTLIGNGGTHEENPNEGVPMGMDSEGIPNLVEEGEVIFNGYVFSKRLKVPKEVRKKYKLRDTKPLTFADAAIQMSKESEERSNDPISQRGLEDSMMKLMTVQEQIRANGKNNKFAIGGKMARKYQGGSQLLLDRSINSGDTSWMKELDLPDEDITQTNWWKEKIEPLASPIDPKTTMASLEDSTAYPSSSVLSVKTNTKEKKPKPTVRNQGLKLSDTSLRYIPAFASGIMSMTDALGYTNKPDYGEANAILEANRGAGTYNPIKFNPNGNYLTYRHFDRDFYINKLNSEASATRRALLNTSGGNRATAMAGLLSADYNALGKMGDLARQAEEYNLAQRQKVEEFNKATNMFNSEGILKANQANQSAQLQARSSYLKGVLAASELRQRERQASTAARSANLSNFINSLGDIGRENFSRNMIVSDPSKYYTIDSNGKVTYKNGFDKLSDIQQRQVKGHAAEHGGTSFAIGGFLTRRKKRR